MNVINFQPWHLRFPTSTKALHPKLGFCTVIAVNGVWRTIEFFKDDGDTTVCSTCEVAAASLMQMNPMQDLAPGPGLATVHHLPGRAA